MPRLYGVYDKNETLVCIGSAQQCADFCGIKLDSFITTIPKHKKPRKHPWITYVSFGEMDGDEPMYVPKRHGKGKIEMKLKYKVGDRIRYSIGCGVEKVGVIRNVDEDDLIAPYSVNGANVREADIIGLETVEPKKKRGRPAKEVADKEESEPVKHDDLFDPEISINKKYEALKKTITLTEFKALVTLITLDQRKMEELVQESMKSAAQQCGFRG